MAFSWVLGCPPPSASEADYLSHSAAVILVATAASARPPHPHLNRNPIQMCHPHVTERPDHVTPKWCQCIDHVMWAWPRHWHSALAWVHSTVFLLSLPVLNAQYRDDAHQLCKLRKRTSERNSFPD